jgi:hypothetical protein
MIGDRIGLCRRCTHARQVPAGNSLYWMCQRSLTDPAYSKYPRLPILECPGYEPRPDEPPHRSDRPAS